MLPGDGNTARSRTDQFDRSDLGLPAVGMNYAAAPSAAGWEPGPGVLPAGSTATSRPTGQALAPLTPMVPMTKLTPMSPLTPAAPVPPMPPIPPRSSASGRRVRASGDPATGSVPGERLQRPRTGRVILPPSVPPLPAPAVPPVVPATVRPALPAAPGTAATGSGTRAGARLGPRALRRRELRARASAVRNASATPLIVRTTIAVGLVAAVGVSVLRADDDVPGSGLFRFLHGDAAQQSSAQAADARLAQQARAGDATSVSRSRAIGGLPGTSLVTGTAAAGRGGTTASTTVTPGGGSSGTPTGAPATGSGGTAAGSGGSTVAAAGDPAAPCRVTYSVNRAGAQFTVMIVIANTGTAAVKGWTLGWSFPPTQKIAYGWNAIVNNGPAGATAHDVGANATIPAGSSTTIGFVGAVQGLLPTPSGFTLNGVVCQ